MVESHVNGSPRKAGHWERRIKPALSLSYGGLMAVEIWIHRGEIPLWASMFPPAVIAVAVLAVAIHRLVRWRQGLRARYRRLRYSQSGLHYSDRGGQEWTIPWNTIVQVRVSKQFGFSSPMWHDTIWLIRQHDGRTTRLDDEHQHHRALVLAFCRRLPGFSFFAANRGCDSDALGEVTCFERTYARHQ
jgi:hypothetical protein